MNSMKQDHYGEVVSFFFFFSVRGERCPSKCFRMFLGKKKIKVEKEGTGYSKVSTHGF